ncbi:unnamed protein product, partial [marine sediment metagenome]
TLNIKVLSLYNNTALTILSPLNNSVYKSNEIFNITIYFNDTTSNQPISGASIDVDVNGTVYSATIFDYGTGYYNITINCSNPIFAGLGWFGIRVNASKLNFINQSGILVINVVSLYNDTELTILSPLNNSIYNSGDIFNITIYFNDTTSNQPISGASIDVDVNGTVYSATLFNYGNGYYNITVDCNDSIFAGYRWFAIRVNASKLNFIN